MLPFSLSETRLTSLVFVLQILAPHTTFILRLSHKKGQDANISPILDSFLDNSSLPESSTPDVGDDDVP